MASALATTDCESSCAGEDSVTWLRAGGEDGDTKASASRLGPATAVPTEPRPSDWRPDAGIAARKQLALWGFGIPRLPCRPEETAVALDRCGAVDNEPDEASHGEEEEERVASPSGVTSVVLPMRFQL